MSDYNDELDVFKAEDGWRWHRKAGNGEVISEGEADTREEDAWRAAYRANPDLEPQEDGQP
jgi:uncharacterized protein YegP (UPF0339 family)